MEHSMTIDDDLIREKLATVLIKELSLFETYRKVFSDRWKNLRKCEDFFIPYLNEVYRNWKPQLHDTVIMMNLEYGEYYSLEIIEIGEETLVAKDTERKNSVQTIELYIDPDYYQYPNFYLPLDVFNRLQIADNLPARDLNKIFKRWPMM